MIEFDKHILPNGLTVIVHHDPGTPIAAVNLLYRVGSKHENPDQTGFAHLFEHLMFGGSLNIPQFDEPLTAVGGDNNAFTSSDLTNYYITVPAQNIETAFWLESDRMYSLAFSEQSLEVQKKVVIEEFNQRYLNQPYGDVWLHLRPLAYKIHPYQWPTIGKDPEHIRRATLQQVKEFFYSHYAPNNAILAVAGPVQSADILALARKWFGSIEKRPLKSPVIPIEPKQTEPRSLTLEREVPYHAVYKAYHMCNRLSPDFPATDLISDILSNGKSSRLFIRLVKEKQLFSNINAFITGDIDEGLLIVTGRLSAGIDFDTAEAELEKELAAISSQPISDYELQKVQNKFEANFTYEESNVLNKAMNLAYYELIGDASMHNCEVERYRKVKPQDIARIARQLFAPENCSTLRYRAH